MGALDLKSPDLEDFATPMGPAPDLWPQIKSNKPIKMSHSNSSFKMKSPSTTDINTIASIQNTVKTYQNQANQHKLPIILNTSNDMLSCSLPVNLGFNEAHCDPIKANCDVGSGSGNSSLGFSETHFDVNGDILSISTEQQVDDDSNDAASKIGLYSGSKESLSSGAKSLDLENQLIQSKNEILLNSNEFDENGFVMQHCSITMGHNGAFLDTKVS